MKNDNKVIWKKGALKAIFGVDHPSELPTVEEVMQGKKNCPECGQILDEVAIECTYCLWKEGAK